MIPESTIQTSAQDAINTLKQWRANPELRPTHGLTHCFARAASERLSSPQGEPSVIDAAIQREWDSDQELRAEFGEFALFRAYAKAQASGSIRVLGRFRHPAAAVMNMASPTTNTPDAGDVSLVAKPTAAAQTAVHDNTLATERQKKMWRYRDNLIQKNGVYFTDAIAQAKVWIDSQDVIPVVSI